MSFICVTVSMPVLCFFLNSMSFTIPFIFLEYFPLRVDKIQIIHCMCWNSAADFHINLINICCNTYFLLNIVGSWIYEMLYLNVPLFSLTIDFLVFNMRARKKSSQPSLHETQDKRSLGRKLDTSWCHCHTSLKLSWS